MIQLFFRILIFAIAFVLPSIAGAAKTAWTEAPHIRVRLVTEADAVVPGRPFMAALVLEPESGWHTYWQNPGDTGLPTTFSWTLPEGALAGDIEWPVPERIVVGGLVNFGYHGRTLLPVEITPPVSAPSDAGAMFSMALTARWLVCEEVCIPGKAGLELSLPWAAAGSAATTDSEAANAIRDALMVRRVELPSRGRFLADGGELAITADLSGALNVATPGERGSVSFFPLSEKLTAYAEPDFVWVDADNAIQIRLPMRENPTIPEVLSGVLVVRQQDDIRQFAINAVEDSTWSPPTVPSEVLSGPNGPATMHKSPAGSGSASAPAEPSRSLLLMALFGFLGGMVLNLMPCVFPVLSLKVVKLAESGGAHAARRRAIGLAYTAGTVTTFVAIAALLLALRATGEQVGWGFQLQSPVFVTLMAYLLFFLGLSMSGVFELGAGLTRVGNLQTDERKLTGSFATGALATIVATPCTAPFMGTAMGFAVSQPPHVALVVFVSLGLGLASPFLAVALVPALGARLPRPGAWMRNLKEVLAFPLYLTCVWLLWVLARQAGPDALARALTGGVLLGLAGWFYRAAQEGRLGHAARIGLFAGVTGALALVPLPRAEDGATLHAVNWSESTLSAALSDGRPVFVNFTADWCITCKVNERAAIERRRVATYFKRHDVLYLKGDWSRSDPLITRELARYERSGVPLYLVFRAGQTTPVLLPQVLTPEIILSAFDPNDV